MPDDLRLSLTIDADTGRAERGVRRTRRETDRLRETVRRSGRAATRSARLHDQLVAANRRLERSARRASGAFGLLNRIGLGVGAGLGIAGLGRSIVQTSASFEQLRLRLKVFEGSASAANARFAELQGYAATTPFALLDVVEAFLRLEATNFEPDLDSFRSLGDIAAASGRSVLELADAIAAVGRGENDPIEGFGFEVRRQGDEVRIAFRDMVRTVDTSRVSILRAFREIGDAKFGGATAELADSLTGSLSNLGDAFDQLQDQVGQGGLSASISQLARDLAETGGRAQGAARSFGALAGTAVDLAPTAAAIGAGYLAVRLHLGAAALATRAYVAATRRAQGPIRTTTRRLTALARGGRVAAASMHGLRRGMTLLGGPFGVVLLAAEAVGLLALRMRDSADAADELDAAARRATASAGRAAADGGGANLQQMETRLAIARRQVSDQEAEVADLAARSASSRSPAARALGPARRELGRLREEAALLEASVSELRRARGRLPTADADADLDPVVVEADPDAARVQAGIDAARQRASDLERLAAARAESEVRFRAVQLAIEREQAVRKAVAAAEAVDDPLLAAQAAGAALREAVARQALEAAVRAARVTGQAAAVQDQADAFVEGLQREAEIADAGAAAARQSQAAYDRWQRGLEVENARREAVADLIRIDPSAAGTDRARQAADLAGQAELQRQATEEALDGATQAAETFAQSAVRGLREWAGETRNRAREVSDAVTGSMDRATDAVARFVATGKADVADLVQSIVADLARIQIRQNITAPLAQSLASALGSAFGAPAGAFDGSGQLRTFAHAGTVVGRLGGRRRRVPDAAFLHAPRAHGGLDLAADEVPIIAQRGERVLSRRERSELGRPLEVIVNHTNRGTPQRLQVTGRRINPRQAILDVVSDDITRGGQTFRALQARGQAI